MPADNHPSCRYELESMYDDDIEPGLWCVACMLPSALRLTQYLYNARTLALYATRHVFLCDECGRYEYHLA